MALFFRAHILYTSMVRLKDISITLRFISSICTDQFNLQKQPGEGEHKLSRKSQKEHFIYQQDVLLQAHICFSNIFAAYVLSWSILSLNSCTVLFWFCMHKTKIWTKARFSLTSFRILRKISETRPRKPTIQSLFEGLESMKLSFMIFLELTSRN